MIDSKKYISSLGKQVRFCEDALEDYSKNRLYDLVPYSGFCGIKLVMSLLLLLISISIYAQVSPDYVKIDKYGSSVNTVTVTTPTGFNPGDLLLVYIVTDDAGSMNHHTDFTELFDITRDGNGPQSGLFYRLLDGTESASYDFTFPVEPAVVTSLIYRNADVSSPFDVTASMTGDSDSPRAPSVTTTKSNRTILQFIGADGASAGVLNYSSPTATLVANGESGSGGGQAEMLIVSEFQAAPGTTPQGEFTFSPDEWTGITIALNTYSISTDAIAGTSCAATSSFTFDYELPTSSGNFEIVDPTGTVIKTEPYSNYTGNTTISFTTTLSGTYILRDQAIPTISSSGTFFIDSDGDSYCDDMDADDDNDGILDIIESPSCFNTLTGYESGDRTSIITVTTDFPFNQGDVQQLVDGNTPSTGNGIRRTSGDVTLGQSLVNFWQLQLTQAIKYTSFSLFTEGSVYLDSDVTGTIQGSNDGTAWTDLTSPGGVLMDDPSTIYSIELTQNTAPYLYYRMSVTGGRVDDDEWFSEIQGTTEFVGAAPYVAGCADQGAIPNHLNTDSDGDGCTDALEGSLTIAVTSVDANGRLTGNVDALGVPILVSGGQGIGGSQNSTYYNLDCPCVDPTNTANNCDFDGDSYKNEIDEDDDNDGITDLTECGDFSFLDTPGGSVNNSVTVCFNPATLGMNGSARTYLDDKLVNPANFGPSGTYKVNFNLVEISASDISVANLVAQGCQIFQVGGESGLSGTEETALTEGQKLELFKWSVQSPSNIVFAFQGMITAWTDQFGSNGTDNPTQATVTGRGIFEGPFGTINAFNQAGSYQGTFTAGSNPICSIMQDDDGGIVGLVDQNSQDIFIADFGLFSEAGGMTNNANLSSASDKMLGNIYAFMAQFILENQSDMCYYLELCQDDFDADSFANVFDHDSDGDDCPDALEGATGFSGTQVQNDTLIGGVGPTGIPVIAGATGQLIGQSLNASLKAACSFDLKLTVDQATATANKGEHIEYMYTLTNESTNPVDEVQVRILIPSNTEFVAAIPSQGSYSNLTKIWDVGTSDAANNETIKITVKIK